MQFSDARLVGVIGEFQNSCACMHDVDFELYT